MSTVSGEQAIGFLLERLVTADAAELLELAGACPVDAVAQDAARIRRDLTVLRRRLDRTVRSVLPAPAPAPVRTVPKPATVKPAGRARGGKRPRQSRKRQAPQDGGFPYPMYPITQEEAAAVRRLCRAQARTPQEAAEFIAMLGLTAEASA